MTLDILSQDLVIGSVMSGEKKKRKSALAFYESVSSVSINHFLHFVENCLTTKIDLQLNLRHIDWEGLIE